MRCFRVDEDVFTGIRLSAVQEGLCIEVGDKKLTLDESLSTSLDEAKQRVVKALDECLSTGEYTGETLEEEDLEQIEELSDIVESESIELIYADIEGKNKIVKEKRRSPDALVLIETIAGVNGRIAFKSTTYDEHVDMKSGRVKRKYRDTFPPPGISVIEEGKSPQGSTCYLLRMMPSSSLRIERTGGLEDAPSVLTIVWKGRKGKAGMSPLLMFSPERRQDQ